jgi:hypothetical protein
VIVGAVPVNAVPSDNVPLIVPLPATDNVSVADCPLQIAVDPLIEACGLALTVTVAEPDWDCVHEFASATLIKSKVKLPAELVLAEMSTEFVTDVAVSAGPLLIEYVNVYGAVPFDPVNVIIAD